ncbi:hypothetical protein D910_04676 [Dendroctonus ponderosae]|uniref:Uncharacterized protein n=1 Tax=Dendroctonus ponderosae TaxID=77166 RepID=U4UBE1_DENPD|nr:hypothetical protein D910_04676 [Dendroctonus ponderosae]
MRRDIPILGRPVQDCPMRESTGKTPIAEHLFRWQAGRVFRAELYAILEVATDKEVIEGLEGEIEIYSDSQAALNALLSVIMGSRLIQECWDALNKVAERKQGNLARIFCPISAEPHIGLNNRQVASALNDWAPKGTTKSWRKAEGCRQAKELIGMPGEANATSKWLMSWSRWALRTLIGPRMPTMWNGRGNIVSTSRSMPPLGVHEKALAWGLHTLLQGTVFPRVKTDPRLRQEDWTPGW